MKMITTPFILRRLAAVACMIAASASAGTLSMETRCVLEGSNLYVHVVNKGDEAAKNVTLQVEFMGGIVEGPAVDKMEPNVPRVLPARMPVESIRGTYPAIIRLGFEDLNGYPFSSVSVLNVRGEDARQSDLVGVFEQSVIRGKANVPLRIYNGTGQAVTASYRIITPRELAADNTEGTVRLEPGDREKVIIPVENFSAMAGSQYGLHAVLEYDLDGLHYASTVGTSVQVFPERSARRWSFWVVVGVVALALGAVLYFQFRRAG